MWGKARPFCGCFGLSGIILYNFLYLLIYSLSSNTKGTASRRRRVQAILNYLESNGVILKFEMK